MTNTIAKTYRDGSIQILDDPSGGNSVNVTLDEGDLQITETRNVQVIMTRGAMAHVRKGPDEPIGWSFSAKYRQAIKQTGESDPTLREAMLQVGAASAWVSTTAATGDVYTFDLAWTCTTPKAGDQDEKVTLEDAWVESVEVQEGEEFNTISVSGRALGLSASGLLTVAKV